MPKGEIMSNVENVTVNLKDVYGNTITDKGVIYFYNQQLTTLSQKYPFELRGTPIVLKDVPAFPNGLAEVRIIPTKYQSKSIFKNISSDVKSIDEVFFLDPKHAKPKLMDFADISGKSYGNKLRQILDNSNVDANIWNNMDKRNRATIFNLSAKILDLEKKHNLSLFDGIEKIETEQLNRRNRARIFARVSQGLFDEVRDASHVFGLAPGIAHSFYGAWRSFPNNSFKTRDKAGNIQFTFAGNNDGLLLADIDLDDSSGIKHVFDVIKHTLSRNDTDPYDIHQILKHFQNIDAEYLLL